jgi:tripeptide aminopeptidase
MDRVPNGDGIKPQSDGERITSDGTTILAADDVSGIAAILEGLRLLQQSGESHGDIEIAFTVCEEKLVTGSRYLKSEDFESRIGYCLDSPGRIGRIINAAPGKAQLHIDVFGRPAHAGNAPEKGVNALKAAAKVLSDMDEGRIDFETTANWAIMTAGSVTNVVCDRARLTGEARSRDLSKLNSYIDYVRAHCAEVIAATEATAEVTVERTYDPFVVTREEPAVANVCRVLERMGITPLVEAGGGGMDANRLNALGIRTVGLATGYSKNHTKNEELYIDDLKKSAEMVLEIIREYAKL